MLSYSIMELGAASAGAAETAIDLGRGAIAGAMIVSASYLAGFAVFKRGSAAVCALLMVLSASALVFDWLGLFALPSPKMTVLLQGLFGASAIVFLSSTIRAARDNALLGGLMFAAALVLVGLGAINFVVRGDAGALMRIGLIAVGAFAAALALLQSPRDFAARLILPGALMALSAPFVGLVFGEAAGSTLIPQALFALGVVSASLVALAQGHVARAAQLGLGEGGSEGLYESPSGESVNDSEQALRLSENQLAQVLDYSGVAVWDWSSEDSHQTAGLPVLIGAPSGSEISPQSFRNLIRRDDVGRFDRLVLDDSRGDGAFDTTFRLLDGRRVRFRGARAVDATGALERLVAFVESVAEPSKLAVNVAAPATSQSSAAIFSKQGPQDSASQDSRLAAVFAEALLKGELTTVFQPIVELKTGRVAGYEALARWPGGNGGPDKASPENLVSAAEASGKGLELAQFVLGAAARHLSEQLRVAKRKDLFVAMNVSVIQIRESAFPEIILAVRREFDLPPNSLVLELTESQAIADVGEADSVFKSLKAAGVALAFDDFGAGFSSLSNLQKYCFDYLKIDKSFVDALVEDEAGAKIARAIAALGRDLGLRVIAEGVESKETADAARAIGCAYAQGYAFGAPAAGAGEDGPKEAKTSRRLMWGSIRR